MKRILFILFLAIVGFVGKADAQQVALKTNALYWATTTPNLGLEVGLGQRTSLDLSSNYNPFTLNKELNKKIKHWGIMPEFRYWFCETFQGHFVGVHTGYLFYNVSGVKIPFHSEQTKLNRYQGWMTGLGVAYGHTWILGERFNLEASIGLGYGYTNFDVYECKNCGKYKGPGDKHYVGPTKLAINLVYMIK
ncbi:MAG: DUF3575 domain-containing protein [Alistipes sp.]|nr:DUF3575 domain-containing protein [Alistipes sp.]